MIVGYYYLHTDGSVIWKRIAPGLIEDFENSDLVRCYWPCDPSDRRGAYRILIEATAKGADPVKLANLAAQWQCTHDDAIEYARREGIDLVTVAGQFVASLPGFVGKGDTPLLALVALYRAQYS
jgi:hypothetical protein